MSGVPELVGGSTIPFEESEGYEHGMVGPMLTYVTFCTWVALDTFLKEGFSAVIHVKDMCSVVVL